jgi:hypothetical protein
MLAYYVFLPLLGILALTESYIPLRTRITLSFLLAGALSIFAGLRAIGIDNDSATYNYVFEYVSNADFHAVFDESRSTSQEPGYLLYLKLLYNIGFTYPIAQLLLNVLSGLLLVVLLKRTTTLPIFGLLIYYLVFYYFRDFTQIRFCVASVLSLWVLQFWFIQERRDYALLTFLLAMSLHNSAIIIGVPIILSYFRIHESYARIAIISFAAIALSFARVTTTILVNVFNLPEQVLRYLDLDDESRAGMMSIVLGLVLALAVLARNRTERGHLCFFYTIFASFIAGMIFSDLSILLRMQLLLFTAVIMAPAYLRDINGKALLLLVCVGALYTHLNNINENLLRPYQTWLFQ